MNLVFIEFIVRPFHDAKQLRWLYISNIQRKFNVNGFSG